MKTVKIAGEHCIISDTCRVNHNGDENAFTVAIEKLKKEYNKLYRAWPVGSNVKFHITLDLERELHKKNPYKVGDKVRLLVDVKDAYQETWHSEGSVVKITRIHKDGEGLMFDSNLGIHFTLVEPA